MQLSNCLILKFFQPVYLQQFGDILKFTMLQNVDFMICNLIIKAVLIN